VGPKCEVAIGKLPFFGDYPFSYDESKLKEEFQVCSYRSLRIFAPYDYFRYQKSPFTSRQNVKNFPTRALNVEKTGYFHDKIVRPHFYHVYSYEKKHKYLVTQLLCRIICTSIGGTG
jgi:hypothetical protein